MTPPLMPGDQVTVKDDRQLPYPVRPHLADGVWFVCEIRGIAAWIAREPRSYTKHATPLSNLRRAEVAV